jgi:hypothetical protein
VNLTLLEATLALLAEATVLAVLAGTLASALALGAAAEREIDRRRTPLGIEQHLDEATLRPAAAVALEVERQRVTLAADLDGDGAFDPSGGERIGFELRAGIDGARLLHHVGRQAMTVAEDLPGASAIIALDTSGSPTLVPARTRLLVLDLGGRRLTAGLEP